MWGFGVVCKSGWDADLICKCCENRVGFISFKYMYSSCDNLLQIIVASIYIYIFFFKKDGLLITRIGWRPNCWISPHSLAVKIHVCDSMSATERSLQTAVNYTHVVLFAGKPSASGRQTGSVIERIQDRWSRFYKQTRTNRRRFCWDLLCDSEEPCCCNVRPLVHTHTHTHTEFIWRQKKDKHFKRHFV